MLLRIGVMAVVGLLYSAPGEAKTLLAVFAHPDDEIVPGALLVKYAAEGHQVFLVTITSGQVGASNTDIPAGDALGAAREEEVRCSCRHLGIEPPILLRFQDGATADRSVMQAIAKRLRTIIDDKKPDVILTWGPDGLSGHLDHRTASNVVTEVLQQKSKLRHRSAKLYYLAFPASLHQQAPSSRARQFYSVDDSLLTTVVDAGKHLPPVLEAIECHQTQWANRTDQIREVHEEILQGRVFLRRALPEAGSAEKEDDIF